jgi:hypothetical protein
MSTSNRTLALTSRGLANIPQSKERNDFTFLVGDTAYPCPPFVADFLSPKLCRLHTTDPTINKFRINTPDPDHHFEDLLVLGSGHSIDVDESAESFLVSAARELENAELAPSIVKGRTGELNLSNAIDRFHLSRLASFASFACEGELEFVSSHFSEFGVQDFDALSIEEFSEIDRKSTRLNSSHTVRLRCLIAAKNVRGSH